MTLTSFAFALEDVFAFYLSTRRRGFFVDIGCGHPRVGSNSKLLESIGWTGLCIDLEKHAEWDSDRTTRCHVGDATTTPYLDLFQAESAPVVIDALFIDVDDACYDTVKAMPRDYDYKIVIIEHDVYRTNKLRDPERLFLASRGFTLVCSDVLHEPIKPFEDWWVSSKYFDRHLIDRIRSHQELDIQIVRKFNYRNTIHRLYGFNGTYPQTEVA